MLGRLNHVAIAVPDLEAAARIYRAKLGARLSTPQALPEHGVSVVFVDLPNTRIELMAPLGAASPIAKFLERHPEGGMHHLCYEVDDVRAARDQLTREGARVLGDGEPKIGAHGKPVIFLNPKDFCRHPDRARGGRLMGLFPSIAVYFVIWWLCLFVVLPFGIRSHREMDDVTLGTDAGAPHRPRMAIRLLATTLVAAVLYGGFFLYFNVFHLGLLDLAR